MALPEWAAALWARAEPYVEPLKFWRGYEADLQTLAIYAVGIAIYTGLVFAFYQQISKREPFQIEERRGWKGFLRRLGTGAIMFPLVSFAYFAVLALSLFVLAKTGTSTYQILLLAMSVITGVRAMTYFSEGAAADLAKMLPLGLLGVLIVDPSYANVGTILDRFRDVPGLAPILWRFFVVFIVLEGALHLVRSAALRIRKRRGERGTRRLTKDAILGDLSRQVPVKEGGAGAPPKQK